MEEVRGQGGLLGHPWAPSNSPFFPLLFCQDQSQTKGTYASL